MSPLVNKAMNVLEVRTDIFKRITRNKMNEKGGIGVSEFSLDIFRVGRLVVQGLRGDISFARATCFSPALKVNVETCNSPTTTTAIHENNFYSSLPPPPTFPQKARLPSFYPRRSTQVYKWHRKKWSFGEGGYEIE